ncbi:MAG: radical SAM/SPASM domain-containing protein [Pseudomonadota bacterium]
MAFFLNDICTLDEGWLRVSRFEPGSPTARVVDEQSPCKNEFWSYKPIASILLRLPDQQISKSIYVTLNLRSVASRRGVTTQQVFARINDRPIETLEVSSETAYTKLLVIPRDQISQPKSCKIILEFPEAKAEQPELIGVPTGTVIGVELSSAAIFTSLDEYLASIQNEYDAACDNRNDLLCHGLNEVTDRGELFDTAKITLNELQKMQDVYKNVCLKLEKFINDPYVLAKEDTRIFFDEDYYHNFYKSLKEGHIHQAIRDWRYQLEAFHYAVIDTGNKEFSFPQIHPKEDDPFIQQLSDLSIPKEKLSILKERNARLNSLEILLQKTTISSVPPSMEIEMTSACNYSCVICGRSYHRFQFTAQNDSKLYRLLSVLPYVKHVTVAGVGENTMSDRLLVLALMLQAFDCDSKIFTNGSLIHRQLDALCRFKRVCVSFDGATSETFETQRRGSRFDHVVRNIKMLRDRAPGIAMAFSVVVSRLNLDEIPDIIRIGKKLGINEIAISPVDHIPELLLRQSDLPLFEKVFLEAQSIAHEAGIALHNNVTKDYFTASGDSPRDRLKLLRHFQSLVLPGDTKKNKEELIAEFDKVDFSYHPSERIHPNNKWPEIAQLVAGTELVILQEAEEYSIDFDIDQELARINDEIERLTDEVKKNSEFVIPYCLSIWKYSYLKANGKARLCPERNVDAGNIANNGFKSTMNSNTIQAFRASMFDIETLQDHCKICLDQYRRWDVHDVLNVCEGLNINPQNLSSRVL